MRGTRTRANYCPTSTAPVRAASARATASRAGVGRWTRRSTPNTKTATNGCVPSRNHRASVHLARSRSGLAPRARRQHPRRFPRNRDPRASLAPLTSLPHPARRRTRRFGACNSRASRTAGAFPMTPPRARSRTRSGRASASARGSSSRIRPRRRISTTSGARRVASCATATGGFATGTPAWRLTTRTTARSSKPTPISSGTSLWTSA